MVPSNGTGMDCRPGGRDLMALNAPELRGFGTSNVRWLERPMEHHKSGEYGASNGKALDYMLDGGEPGVSEASNGTRTDCQPGDRQLWKHHALNGMWLDCHPGGCVYTAHGASNGTQLDRLPGGRDPGLGRAHTPTKGQRRRLSMGRTSDKDSHDDAKDSVARGGTCQAEMPPPRHHWLHIYRNITI